MNISIVDGKKDGSSLYHCHDGFHYYFNKGNSYNEGNSTTFYLRCRKYYKRGCCGTAKIDSTPNGLIWTNLKRHTCAPNPTHHHVLNLRREILEESTREHGPYETPAEVVRRVRHRYPIDVAAQVTGNRMRAAIRRRRNAVFPNVPRTLYNLGDMLADGNHNHLTRCHDGLDNIYAGRAIGPNGTCSIIFASRIMRRFLRRCKTVYCDGTFGSRPNMPGSSQVLQIIAIRGRACIPVAQILMTGKTQQEYVAAFERLRQLVPQFRPTLVMTDFEVGLQNAWRQVFNTTVTGCYWHYCRAVSLKAKQLGLGALMRENRVLRSLIRSTLAIPLLPRHLMARGLESLMREANLAGLINVLQPFFNYYIDTWMAPAVFQSLSVNGIRHRTNNVCESANRLLRSLTGAHRPGLWHFISALRRFEHDARLTLRRWVMGMNLSRKRKTSAVNNDTRIRNFTFSVMMGEITINRFLHLASTRVIRIFDNFNGV